MAKYNRPTGFKKRHRVFVIASEGHVTEPQYFYFFNKGESAIHVECIKRTHSKNSPDKVLRSLKEYIKEYNIENDDEAWLVVDTDNWEKEQLDLLHEWSLGKSNYGLAVSNPKFELWLLLHFEDGSSIKSSRNCSDRLKKHLPNYDKHLDQSKFKTVNIKDAIRRAQANDSPPCGTWPKNTGTTVYCLVSKLIDN